jgi:hypothetical protein
MTRSIEGHNQGVDVVAVSTTAGDIVYCDLQLNLTLPFLHEETISPAVGLTATFTP